MISTPCCNPNVSFITLAIALEIVYNFLLSPVTVLPFSSGSGKYSLIDSMIVSGFFMFTLAPSFLTTNPIRLNNSPLTFVDNDLG